MTKSDGGLREMLLHLFMARRQSLLMVVAGECLEHVAVALEAIAPGVLAHQLARRVELGHAPGQAGEEMADLPELVPAELLRLDERLQHVYGEPRMLLGERAADADDVHDREHL